MLPLVFFIVLIGFSSISRSQIIACEECEKGLAELQGQLQIAKERIQSLEQETADEAKRIQSLEHELATASKGHIEDKDLHTNYDWLCHQTTIQFAKFRETFPSFDRFWRESCYPFLDSIRLYFNTKVKPFCNNICAEHIVPAFNFLKLKAEEAYQSASQFFIMQVIPFCENIWGEHIVPAFHFLRLKAAEIYHSISTKTGPFLTRIWQEQIIPFQNLVSNEATKLVATIRVQSYDLLQQIRVFVGEEIKPYPILHPYSEWLTFFIFFLPFILVYIFGLLIGVLCWCTCRKKSKSPPTTTKASSPPPTTTTTTTSSPSPGSKDQTKKPKTAPTKAKK